MQLVDAGMLALPAYHALAGKVERTLTYQLPRMLRAREIGEDLGIRYLTDRDPSEEFGVLLDWGRRTRNRLSELGLD